MQLDSRVMPRMVGLSCLALAGLLVADPPKEPAGNLIRFEQTKPLMGTQFRLVFYATGEPTASAASKEVFARIDELNSIYSDYDDHSELSRLSRSAGGPPMLIGSELFDILNLAEELSRKSGGAFDITIGPVVRLWRRARRLHKLPSTERISETLSRVGYQKVRLDEKRRTAQLLVPGMRLDLGGIAKGAACDEALAVLKRHGINRALVDGGGDIAVGASPPGRAGWKISLFSPDVPNGDSDRFLLVHDCGVATSGDNFQHVEIDDVRYSHIVDPQTGIGSTDRRRVTVIAPTAVLADGLASAASILPPNRALALIDQIPGAAGLIVRGEEDNRESFASKRWEELSP